MSFTSNMGSRRDFFYKNLLINDEDRNRAESFLTSKGVEKHIIIKEKLFTWIGGKKIEYSMIASTYRYDKRLRLILFRYISYLEEFYRAAILDSYRFFTQRFNWHKEIKETIDEYDGNLNDALERIEFSSLLNQIKDMPSKVRRKCYFPNKNKKNIQNNIDALISLRNAVMHNKFLLLYRGFEECYVDGVDNNKSASLKANIINLLSFLPKDVADNCKKEINDAKNERENQGTKWNLPEMVVVDV